MKYEKDWTYHYIHFEWVWICSDDNGVLTIGASTVGELDQRSYILYIH